MSVMREMRKFHASRITQSKFYMAKKITGQIKLQIPAGQANPAPPVGPALGQHGVNIMGFCKEFNAVTKNDAGLIIPVVITVYQDKSFTFITKSPPASVLLKKAAGITAGSKTPNKDKGRQGHAQTDFGHRENEVQGHPCQFRRRGGPPDSRAPRAAWELKWSDELTRLLR